jgi:hypothetical protein
LQWLDRNNVLLEWEIGSDFYCNILVPIGSYYIENLWT